MSKHTPGPWLMAAKPSSVVGWPIVGPGGRAVALLNYVQHSMIDTPVAGDRAFNAESAANGKLIAAAPALVEALREAMPFIDDSEDVHSLFPDSAATKKCREVVIKARAALALAGEE